MSRIIHARLDAATVRMLRDLEHRLGWNDSQIVREGIKALNGLLVQKGARRIVGLGRFRSEVPDLGFNKKHVQGFGTSFRSEPEASATAQDRR